MRAVVERVKRAEVRVEGRVAGRIDEGLLVLVGIATGDTRECGQALAEKIVNLRLFEGEQGAEPIDQPGPARGRMQRSLLEKGGCKSSPGKRSGDVYTFTVECMVATPGSGTVNVRSTSVMTAESDGAYNVDITTTGAGTSKGLPTKAHPHSGTRSSRTS